MSRSSQAPSRTVADGDIPMTFVPIDDPQWSRILEVHLRHHPARRRPVAYISAYADPQPGFWFRTAYVVEAANSMRLAA